MKQILPLILIALIVGGAMYFLNDSYEQEEFLPDWSSVQQMNDWEATLFLNNVEEEVPKIGVRLELLNENLDIDALEFFVESNAGGFYYQDLDINEEEFDKTITYTEDCHFCEKLQGEYPYGHIVLHWRESGFIRSEYFYFDLTALNSFLQTKTE